MKDDSTATSQVWKKKEEEGGEAYCGHMRRKMICCSGRMVRR